MKKLFSVLAIVALAACNDDATKSNEVKPTDSTATVAPAKDSTIAKPDSTSMAKPDSAAAAK